MTNRASHGFSMALIEIDGLPSYSMVDLSMFNDQMVLVAYSTSIPTIFP